jgi:hypothetical protein
MNVFKNLKEARNAKDFTSLKGYITATYSQLVEELGEPTFNTPSDDGKTQVEWVVEFENNYYTIYDWKTYNREYTLNKLDTFNVGSRVNALEFILHLNKKLAIRQYFKSEINMNYIINSDI